MKRKICKNILLILLFFTLTLSVKADELSIYSNMSSVKVGSTVAISVRVSGYAGTFRVSSSDSSILSGGCEDWYEDNTYTCNFSAKSTGTATITVSAIDVADSNEKDYTGSKSISVKVVSASSGGSSSSGSTGGGTTSSKKNYSSDNYLKELGVEGYELSPKFDKDTLEYSLKVDESVEKIKINATANDSKASVSGAGEITLTPGENKIEIKVTAENGNEKVYKLNITVEDQKPIKVTIDKANYTIVKKNHDETIKPENFEETTIKIDDQDVIAYINKKSNLTLVVLKNNQGKTGLYVYDAKRKSYTPYKVLKVGSLTLYIQNMDKNDIPKGYSKYSFKVNDVSYTSYRLSQSSKFDLIYGMNVENGEKSLYIYDEKEGTLQRYDEDMLKDLTSKYKSEQKYLYIAVSGLIALSLVLIVVLIVSNKKKKRKNKVKI